MKLELKVPKPLPYVAKLSEQPTGQVKFVLDGQKATATYREDDDGLHFVEPVKVGGHSVQGFEFDEGLDGALDSGLVVVLAETRHELVVDLVRGRHLEASDSET